MMEDANSRLNAPLLHEAQPTGLTFLWSNLAEQTSGTCKQTPRFRHLVITRTGRVFVLQFIITRVGRAAFQAGQSERLLQILDRTCTEVAQTAGPKAALGAS